MKRAFLYKAKISKETEKKTLEWLYLCRTLYNACIEQRIDAWQRCRKSIKQLDQQYELPRLKEECPEFKVVNAQTLQRVTRQVDHAFQAFFRRVKKGEKPGFPRFKGRDWFHSFALTVNNGWKLVGRNLYISRLGCFKLHLYRPILGDIKTVTVRCSNSGKWWVSFSCDNVPENVLEPCKKEIGLDMGLKVFLADSDGNLVENPRFYQETQKELRRKQRSLSRKAKGSNRRKKAKVEVVKLHEKIANQREEFIRSVARDYIKRCDVIYVEDLKIKNMLKHGQLAKSISDVAWGMFINRLQMDAEEAGRKVILVDPRNTSQACLCGEIVPKSLAVRVHRCPKCGLEMDRDILAAKNILRAGQARQALTKPLGLVA